MTHPASTHAAATRLQSPPGSTVPYQAISSKGNGMGNICGYVHHFYPGPFLGSGRRGVLYGRKHTQARLVAASSLVTLVPCSSWLSGCKEPAGATLPWHLHRWGRAAPAMVWARAAPDAEFRAHGTAAEHLSDPEHVHLICRTGWQSGSRQALVAKAS